MPGTNGHSTSVASQSDLIRAAQAEEARALSPQLRAAQEASVLLARAQFLRQAGITFKGARDFYETFGYSRNLSFREYQERYARGGIAGRIVDVYPNATWRGSLQVVEDLDVESNTPFEKAWKDLDQRLQVQAKLKRADQLSLLSHYSVLLIGARGDLASELPKGGGKQDNVVFLNAFSGGGGPWSANSFSTRNTMIDADVTIASLETDTSSPRFGLAKTYQLARTSASGATGMQNQVHWSRIVHVADGCLFDDLYGQPALERVWNLLDDLDKVTGGGSEAFFLRANQGLHLNIDKDMQGDALKQVAALKEQAEDYKHQMTRWLRTKGVEIDVLGSDVANFSNQCDAILTQISGAKGIPKRILTGSEMGEMASSQDRDNWKDQIVGRQLQYAGPYIVRALVDRLIQYRYLPPPTAGPSVYEVKWPHIQTLTEQEKAEGIKAWASANATNKVPLFLSEESRRKWYDMSPLTVQQIEKEKELKEAINPTPPPPVPGEVPGNQPPQLRAAEAELLSVLQDALACGNHAVVKEIVGLGGKGSGNFGHSGRPGERGGSGGGSSYSEDDHYEALSDYLTGKYKPINTALRSESGKLSDTIAKIDSAFHNPNLTTETGGESHYRGINGKQAYKTFSELKKGDVVGEKAYLSTTHDKDTAGLFAAHGTLATDGEEPKSSATPGVLLEIKTPGGVRFLSGSEEEGERIFPRGTRLKVRSVQKTPKLVHVVAEMLK